MPEDGDSPSASDVSIGEIPTIEIMELTPDIARRALDSYIAAKDKYADADFEQFENLEDFVDQSADGKNFASDVHAAGFATVSDWNLAVTTLGLTYSSVIDDQSADLMLQIEEIEGDDQLAQDMKDKMIKALRALIPSANNKKIVEEMMADPVYGERLKQLDIEEE
jgi:predicted transport protein